MVNLISSPPSSVLGVKLTASSGKLNTISSDSDVSLLDGAGYSNEIGSACELSVGEGGSVLLKAAPCKGISITGVCCISDGSGDGSNILEPCVMVDASTWKEVPRSSSYMLCGERGGLYRRPRGRVWRYVEGMGGVQCPVASTSLPRGGSRLARGRSISMFRDPRR